jgi:hypothetical protein
MNESPYEHVKWGSFKRRFERRPHELHHLQDLHSFASYILSHQEDFTKRAVKQARFYHNLIEHSETAGSVSISQLKRFIDNSYKHTEDSIDGFLLDKELSTHETQVFVNHQDKRLIIVFTGTYKTLDWINNYRFVVGEYKQTRRFKNAKKVFEEALKKYHGYIVTLLGHSQGFIPEDLLNDRRVYEVIGYNGATLGTKLENNEYMVRTSNDIVSLLTPKSERTITIPSRTMNPLREHSTTPLEGLPQDKLIGRGLRHLLSQYKTF